jgi:hypothetical protein
MALSPALSVPWNPLRITGTPMPPNLLLMCKIVAVAFLGTGHYRILPDPFLPFVPMLDELAEPEVVRAVLRTVAVASAVALLFNRWVRACTLLLGCCFLLAVVSSKAYYGNNKTFCGLLLVMAGLSDFDRPASLFRWQFCLVYFGAALNKLLDPDWQSGLFFEHWAGERLQNPVFITVSGALPTLLAGKLLCWGTILAEFGVALGLLVPRLVPYALWINVFFQVGLLEFTGNTFTLFFYGMQAATLAFVTWPECVPIYHDDRRPGGVGYRRFLQLFDPDGLQDWRPTSGGDRGTGCTGLAAFRHALLFSPVFWLGCTWLLAAMPGPLGRRLLVAGVLLFFLPLLGPWVSKRRHQAPATVPARHDLVTQASHGFRGGYG